MRAITIGNQIIRLHKIATFLFLYVVVIGVPYLMTALGYPYLKRLLGGNWWVVPISTFGLLSAFAPLIYMSVMREWEDKALEEQRRYHKTLVDASAGMIRVRDVHGLCRLIVHVVTRAVGLSHAAVFLYDEELEKFKLAAVRNKAMLPETIRLAPEDAVVQWLKQERTLVRTIDLRQKMRDDVAARTPAAATYQWMRDYEFRLLVPSFTGDKLLGFLALGKKRNGKRFSSDDIAIFSALTNQATLAIQNAFFYEELRKNEAYMIQSEKLASLGQLASGMAHEIHNPLSIISGEAQLYLERFRNKDEQVDHVLTSIIEECRRAADITRRILRFAKPSRNDYVPVDIKAAVEDCLKLVGYQVRLDSVERVLDFPDNLPKVSGNLNQLQEVVLNLIVNACHAMGERGGKLTLSAGPSHNGHIVLKVADTGQGIEEDKLKKIFDPFFTTKSTGTGLGLFVSQRIVEAHGGTIHVESQLGEGTCFTIKLPVHKH